MEMIDFSISANVTLSVNWTVNGELTSKYTYIYKHAVADVAQHILHSFHVIFFVHSNFHLVYQ